MLGREGPTVQIGGNIGRMVLDIFRLKGDEARHTLLATGAAAGLAAAFNAPLAGILFIIEEMRPQFRYTLISIKAVFIGVIMSTIMYRIFNHEVALIDVGKLSDAPLNTLWLYLILGIIFGIFGPIFNKWVLGMQDLLHRVHGGNITKWVLMGGVIGGLCGLLGFVAPATSGGGFNLIPIATAGISAWECWCLSSSRGSLPPYSVSLPARRAVFCPDAGAGYCAGNRFRNGCR